MCKCRDHAFILKIHSANKKTRKYNIQIESFAVILDLTSPTATRLFVPRGAEAGGAV